MQDLKTKLLEIESKMEDTKTNTDTDFQVHLGKINQLEKDRSFHISLINDHEARIKQLDIEGDTNSNVIQKLNNTLTQLASDIVANEEAIQVQQTRFNEPESNRSLDQGNIQTSFNESITWVES